MKTWLKTMADIGLLRELEKNYNDKVAIEAQVEKFKRNFAKELTDGGIGNAMTAELKTGVKPIKLKKPLNIRIKENINSFKNKLKIVVGIQ